MSEKEFAFYDPTLFDKHVKMYKAYADLLAARDKIKTPLVVFGKNTEGEYVPFNAGQISLSMAAKNKDFYHGPFMQNMGEIAEQPDLHLVYIDDVVTENLTSNAESLKIWANKKWNSKNGSSRKPD